MSISCLSLTSVFHLIILKIKKIRIHLSVQEINSKLLTMYSVKFSSVTQSCPTLRPHEPQHARPPCPSPTPGVHPNPCPLSWWCHADISSSVVPFSTCLQSFPASGSFSMSQVVVSGGQSTWASSSTSVLPMNIQDWFPLGLTSFILLCPRESQESPPTPQFKSINSSVLNFPCSPTLPSYMTIGKNIACLDGPLLAK